MRYAAGQLAHRFHLLGLPKRLLGLLQFGNVFSKRKITLDTSVRPTVRNVGRPNGSRHVIGKADAFNVGELFDGEGNIAGVEGTVRNITDQKRAEQALSDSETRYRQLAELSPDGMFVHVAGEIVFANASLARILAVSSPEDLLGKPSFDLLAPEYRARALERRDDLMKGDVLESTFRRFSGFGC